MLIDLLRHQQRHYARFHRDRNNLRLHLCTVPVFQAGHLMLMLAPALGPFWLAPIGLGMMMLALALQRRGHALEVEAVEPFRGPVNAVLRICFEQWLSFPRFALTGGWRLAFQAPSRK
ncbi:terminase [Paucibacter sp. APW11]|uniref:Terminase n=1 Tax=Roseateles aquae TaxID=3077235 RepID=A0ABU3PJ73_9BURK|nr:terminase [Paucibacter sp. APW11]MDT9002197.1 terminase [Paucibacter sp. APW11]